MDLILTQWYPRSFGFGRLYANATVPENPPEGVVWIWY